MKIVRLCEVCKNDWQPVKRKAIGKVLELWVCKEHANSIAREFNEA